MFGPRIVLEGPGARQAGALSTTVAEGFTEEPFLQMRYLDPIPINDWGNEELGLLGIRQGNPAPSSKAGEVRAQKVLPGTKRMVVPARREWTPSSFEDSGHGDKVFPFVAQVGALIPRPFGAKQLGLAPSFPVNLSAPLQEIFPKGESRSQN